MSLCRKQESNLHRPFGRMDFKSIVSTNSTIAASSYQDLKNKEKIRIKNEFRVFIFSNSLLSFLNFLMSALLEDTCVLALIFNSTKDWTNCLKLAIIFALSDMICSFIL